MAARPDASISSMRSIRPVFLFALAGCTAAPAPTPAVTVPQVETPLAAPAPAASAAAPFEGFTLRWVAETEREVPELKFRYPQITAPRIPGVNEANARIAAMAKVAHRDILAAHAEGGPFDPSMFYSDANCTAPLTEGGLNVVCHISTFPGGAHGKPDIASVTYVVDKGALVELDLMAALDARGRRRIATWVRDDLVRQGASSVDATAPFATTQLTTFSFDESGLYVLFAPYDVGSYAEGPYRVRIGYDQVQEGITRPAVQRLIQAGHDRERATDCSAAGGECMEGCDEGFHPTSLRGCFDSACCVFDR
jgi:hypothetical protein